MRKKITKMRRKKKLQSQTNTTEKKTQQQRSQKIKESDRHPTARVNSPGSHYSSPSPSCHRRSARAPILDLDCPCAPLHSSGAEIGDGCVDRRSLDACGCHLCRIGACGRDRLL